MKHPNAQGVKSSSLTYNLNAASASYKTILQKLPGLETNLAIQPIRDHDTSKPRSARKSRDQKNWSRDLKPCYLQQQS